MYWSASTHPKLRGSAESVQSRLPATPASAMGPRKTRFPIGLVLLLLVAVFVIAAVTAVFRWPFTQSAVIQALQQQSGSSVQFAGFKQTYFPHPGCVADGVTFHRNGDQASRPFMTIDRLTVTGSYSRLLTRHIEQIRAEGMHVVVSMQAGADTAPGISVKSGIVISEIIADGAQLEVLPAVPGHAPLVFPFQQLSLYSVYDDRPFTFRAHLKIPLPPGQVSVSGQFGPWKSGDGGQTPLSGSYTLEQADLGVFSGIAGTVSASGKFGGVLQHMDVTGTTDTPDFALTRNQHPVHLTTRFQALVNGLNGDVVLQPVTAQFGRTEIVANTDIEVQSDGQGKTVAMTAYSTHARIEDLLRLFTRDVPAPMTGAIALRGKIAVPPENRPFLDKVRLQGDFGITGGQYTKAETQRTVDVLSARARGNADIVEDAQEKAKKQGDEDYDPGRVLTNVKGHVVLRNAIATLTNVSFDVPGASAVMSGTYNLRTEQVNLKGPVLIEAKLPQTTTGVKSFLLKIVQPVMPKNHKKGATVEVRIGGTYHNPTFTAVPVAK